MIKKHQFDAQHDAALLRAAGYTHAFVPGRWENLSSDENGLKLGKCPNMHVWTLDNEDRIHEVIVINGEVIFAEETEYWVGQS